MGKKIDTFSDKDELICPHCGHIEKIDDEVFEDCDLEFDDIEAECEECGKTFTVSRTVRFYFETFKKK